MKTSVQQIMLGTLTKNYDSTLTLLKHLKEIGFDAIELNSFMIHPSSFFIRMLTKLAGMPTGNGGKLDWHKLIKESGLEVTSLHSDLGSLEREPQKVIDEAKSFNTNYIVITGLYRFNHTDLNELKKLCERLNNVGKILKESNMNLLYHNHNVEFKRLENGQYVYEYIIENTNPEYVNFEFDSYWCVDCGANPLKMMKKLGQRMKLYHINDRGSKDKGPYMTPILKSDSMELGTGSMDLETLIDQAYKNGVSTIVLETHRNFIDKSPLKSIDISSKYLKENLK